MSRISSALTHRALDRHLRRFQQLRTDLQRLDCFCKGTVLKRMMKCGKPSCVCQSDPAKRHGPYYELTYKVNGKTVNVKLSSQTVPLYRAAALEHRRIKTLLNRLEKLSRTILQQRVKLLQSARED